MMILRQNTHFLTFPRGNTSFSFLPSGDIFEFTQDGFLINGFQGCAKEGSANNIWLRIYGKGGISAYPLLGVRFSGSLSRGENMLIFDGIAESVSYRVTFFAASEGLWFWNVELNGEGETVDLIYGQDIGIGLKSGVLTNELYIAQYLGHSIFYGENGYLVCSRQNLPQNGKFPYLQQGMAVGKAVGFSTDGTQFFGLSYKAADLPAALAGDLPNLNYQFELSYTALQSEKVTLHGRRTAAFYGFFRPDHPGAVKEPEFREEIQSMYRYFRDRAPKKTDVACAPVRIRSIYGAPYVSPEWGENDLKKFFPEQRLVERENGKLLSFFTERCTHVVLQQKELLTERPHGNIIMSRPSTEKVSFDSVSSTNYMYGLFNGQTAVGNTSFHRLLSVPRGMLNILKNSGQRLYIELDGVYRMLTLPAAYEMGMNFSRWFYVLPQDTLVVVSYTVTEQPDVVLDVQSLSGKTYRFFLANQLALGENEFAQDIEMENCGPSGQILRIRPGEGRKSSPYPHLHYDIQFPHMRYTVTDDRIFFKDYRPRDGTMLCVAPEPCNAFRCVIQGRLSETAPEEAPDYDFKQERYAFDQFYTDLSRGFHLCKADCDDRELESLNVTARWFSHNAMIHFAAPHGLEQSGGAAWGTRDVCQGPMEYFLAMGYHSLARDVLLTVFSHQNLETGEWPQWFMFDRYRDCADECHGDVFLWPLKAISDYLEQTGDSILLRETVPCRDNTGGTVQNGWTLLDHIRRAFETLEKRFLPGTALISYAGGDWDDTLQPADEKMKDHLVSAWTQALAYQVLKKLARVLRTVDSQFAALADETARKIGNDFVRYLVWDGVVAGFAYCRQDGSFQPMLHPRDEQTGIHYRLLPMTRSIIAGLASREQARRNVQIIDERLRFPDGVRIMDHPARYDGGVSRFFRRAEQAANVGREISLQYTHAHIRYLEAMAKLGEADRVWDGLFIVNPVTVRDSVPNAAPRQRNLYFSSSDGMFPDRYRYNEDFEKLRDGTVEVKGGWRLYSSGPGIYLRQLISNILGIRFMGDCLVIDPVLPRRMDGLQFIFACFGQSIMFVYHIAEKRKGTLRILRGGQELPSTPLTNPYRAGGIKISRKAIESKTGNIDIIME